MNRFFEYTTNHPFLVAAAAILAVLAIVFEMRHRARGSSSIGTTDAVRLANSGALLVDVRDSKDYEAGHIIEARNIPAAEIASRAELYRGPASRQYKFVRRKIFWQNVLRPFIENPDRGVPIM